MILQSFYTYLTSLSLCDAIYPEFLPQQHALPAIVIELDSANDLQVFEGQSQLHEAFVTVNVYDPSLLVAGALADSVKAALNGYTGAFGTNEAQNIYMENLTSAPETSTGLRGIALQFYASYY